MRNALLVTGLGRGGAELQVLQLAAALQSRGWEVEVFALTGGALEKDFHARGIPASVRGFVRLLRFRPHIVHSHLFHANLAARLLRLLLPFPAVISTVHSHAESSRRTPATRSRDFAYRFTDALTDATVFVCQAAADRHLKARAARPDRARVIPNGIDTAAFHPAPAKADTAGGFTWLAAGRLMWKKNYPLLLRAMERQPESSLWIAGDGPDADALRSAAPPNVRFLGPRTDIAALMHAADAFVLTSTVEGLPLVLLEAAASGLPCVASRVGGVPDAVIDRHTGYLFESDDLDGLVSAMQRLSRLPPRERAAMSQHARHLACERFSMDAVTSQWERLYRELLEREQ